MERTAGWQPGDWDIVGSLLEAVAEQGHSFSFVHLFISSLKLEGWEGKGPV